MTTQNFKISAKQIVFFCIIFAVLVALTVGNIFCYLYRGVITNAVCGNGTKIEGEEVEKAKALGDELCRDIGEDSIVLYKNQEIRSGVKSLPLSKDLKKVNIFGWSSTDGGFLLKGIGSGSSTISEDKKVTLLKAFEDAKIEYNKDIINAYKTFSSSRGGTYELIEPTTSFYGNGLLSGAKQFSDTAIIVVSRNGGENQGEIPTTQNVRTESGSSSDTTRTYLQTSAQEDALIEMASLNFNNVILIVNSANTMHLSCLAGDKVDSAIYIGLSGQSSTSAIPKVLWGDVNPSGKVADTYVYSPVYDPTYANREKSGGSIQYVEDIYYGYKWYETADVENYWSNISNSYGEGYNGVVQYPFGYGLSYTDFSWEVTNLSMAENTFISKYMKFEIEVTVTNTGSVAGKDVVEIYATPPYTKGGIEKAHVNLVAFGKTALLNPGQSQVLKLTFNAYDMASYDCYDKNENNFYGYELEEGDYKIKVMKDSHTIADFEGAVINYKVAEGGLRYKMDPTTKQIVKNRMTGETAYSGVPIDGSNVGAELKYLSRSNFAEGFPTQHAKTPSSSLINTAATYFNTAYNTESMPTTGVESNLRLVVKEDGTNASLSELEGGTALKANEELFKELSNYKSEKWETLLNQMSISEYCDLIENGGFKTKAVASIGKPKNIDIDGPAGFNSYIQGVNGGGKWTAYPSETFIGCSWNSELAYNMGLSMGVEGNATGVSGWYAPGVNLHRSSYTARNFEYYSEDGVISGKLAAEVIRGAKTNGLYCYLKHFVVSEPGPNPGGLNTWLTEQNLRENYLKPFEIAVKEGGANAIMSAFNRVGANWAGASYPCLTQILRTEWGFKGSVLTDYSSGGGVGYMNPEQGVRAGNDIWLNPNGTNSNPLKQSDATSVACARNSAKNIIYTYVDTYYYAKTHTADGDDRYSVEVGIKTTESVFPWWIIVLAGIDVVTFGVLGLCTFLTIKPKQKKQPINIDPQY